MIRSRLIVAASLTLLALFAACGGDDDAPTASPTANPDAENALAESLLLDVDDFPSGWTEGPADDDEASPFDRCDDQTPSAGRTGEAESGEFSEGTSAEVQQSVASFDSSASAAASLDQVRALGECLAEVVNNGELDDEAATYTNATVTDHTVPTVGDRTDGYRLELDIEALEEDGSTSKGKLYLDIVFVTEGRLAFFIQAGEVYTPFDSAMLEDLVEKAHAKLVAADEG